MIAVISHPGGAGILELMTYATEGSRWSSAETVAGFVQAAPNATLLRFADAVRTGNRMRALDLGCGAGRNAIPLAHRGWNVIGVDNSWPMLAAAAARARQEDPQGGLSLVASTMDLLPVEDACADLIVAHGIWNLARSGVEFRAAVREAARIAKPGAGLFVFTFSRQTLPVDVAPIDGESFVYTQFAGEPQCFLTEAQLVAELDVAGFEPDPAVPLVEHNRPAANALRTGNTPVIYEAAFRHRIPRVTHEVLEEI